ncbi:hypothetical protein IVB45_18625 [Bradyrhizobium sp. 4]|uniref:hypothetical protein n=1 Tax=unclassified Bradyrhizobium TaxID=2631580 RepID=UPI001FFACFF7|nr:MULTISPECIES: hypothetical protein [unclassified Bradyrhizobium]MCK1400137.1 hypothetical protein [Bradyrhizobium sp. 39]MCK1750427.1 hypothetical protein [Bradyrhizobium sp. 135]UPJ32036.1 hypothetical protein IVB45_18625 [Bradyrhizobium sp. 4]
MNVFVATLAGAAIPARSEALPAPNVREGSLSSLDDPDASLTELGREYESLLRQEVPLRRKSHRLYVATETRRREILGLEPSDETEQQRTLTQIEFRKWNDAWNTAGDETGYRKAWEAWCQACKRTRKVGRKILRIKAQTLPGLLIRSRVITTNGELLCKGEPIDELGREIRAFTLAYQAA